jgi:hypothetical protein
MAFVDPGFGTQVLQIQPQRRWLTLGHALFRQLGEFAGKCLDDQIAGLPRR